MKPKKQNIIHVLLICGFMLGFYATCIEPFQLKVVERVVTTPKMKPGASLRIALISDIHFSKPWMTVERVKTIAATTNALNPDLVLMLGDYAGTDLFQIAVQPQDGAAVLPDFKGSCGTFAVLGNHDFDPRAPEWDSAVKHSGVPVLENSALKVDCHGVPLWIAGVKDQWHQTADLTVTLKSAMVDDDPVILMMHEPDLYPETPDRVTLSVAGHTHGGQVRLPFIGAVMVPSKFGTKYAYGHYNEGGRDFVVSSGLGMSILPVRFLMPPEITLVTLKSP